MVAPLTRRVAVTTVDVPPSILGPSTLDAATASDDEVRRRQLELMAMTIVILNVLDVLITRVVLRTHPASHEGNGLIARLIFSPWVLVPKVGLPLLVLMSSAHRRITRPRYVGMAIVAAIYWAVIAWNLHILVR
ncbi:MAG: hypothetical protein NVSMB16_11540 [Acidimicrobiales bacterium]